MTFRRFSLLGRRRLLHLFRRLVELYIRLPVHQRRQLLQVARFDNVPAVIIVGWRQERCRTVREASPRTSGSRTCAEVSGFPGCAFMIEL